METQRSEEASSALAGSLTGQVALVTGGARGIGRAIAEALAAAGASVAVMARSADQVAETVSAIETNRGRALGIVGDVTDQAAVERAVEQVENALGAITLLVNNAAVLGTVGPSWEVDPDEWWRCQEINLRGPFLCARAVLPHMVKRRQGRIINVASVAGIVGLPYASAYFTSKAALIRYSEILAAETEAHGIAVFAIHPGDVETLMANTLRTEEVTQWLPWTVDYFAKNLVPASRPADLVLWLAAGKGDALSGCYISIHDDLEALATQAATIRQDKLRHLRLRQ